MKLSAAVPAPLRGLALLLVALAGWVVLILHVVCLLGIAGLIFLIPFTIERGRVFTAWSRRLIGEWTGVDVMAEYQPRPGPPQRGPDGMYRADNSLYKRPLIPNFSQRLKWVINDPATARDLRWLLLSPFGALALVFAPDAYGRFSRALLRPAKPRSRAGANRAWVVRHGLALVRLGSLLVLTLFGLAVLFTALVGMALVFGLGMVFLLPAVGESMRGLLNWRRHLAGRWSGVEVAQPYRPRPAPPMPREDGRYQAGKQLYRTAQVAGFTLRTRWIMRDPATWRDLLFLTVDPVIGGLIALPAVAAVAYGLWGLALPALWHWLFGAATSNGYGAVAASPLLAVLVGLALAWTGARLATGALRLHGWWSRVFLAPTKAATLAQQVARLAQSRADATDVQAAELRRIERDLHDGAQARMVAVGLSLDAIERLIDTDPAQARRLAAQAREAAGTALAELRALVRGIHPPVLAERGLVDAVRALALDTPVPVQVTTQMSQRLPAPVESAAYFAVAEALANAVRHAQARLVTVDIRDDGATLRIVVADDGCGGADAARGSGLQGMSRRLGMFDGELSVVSPAGGPTTLTMQIPSPRAAS